MNKTCPYCGGELLTGYIQSRDGVCWSEKKKLVSALPGLAKDELYLPDGHIGKEVTALNCPKCRVILINYEDYPYDHPISAPWGGFFIPKIILCRSRYSPDRQRPASKHCLRPLFPELPLRFLRCG